VLQHLDNTNIASRHLAATVKGNIHKRINIAALGRAGYLMYIVTAKLALQPEANI
jgi:hypothetical protein